MQPQVSRRLPSLEKRRNFRKAPSNDPPIQSSSCKKDLNFMLAQRMMWIAWPAFLVAGVIEMLVFALVDPQSLHWFGQPLALSREAVYTLAFFVFWLLTMASSALTTLLAMSPFEVNRRQLAADARPESGAKEVKVN